MTDHETWPHVERRESHIDPFHYGQLTQKVNSLEAKVDSLNTSMEELLALANKGRGGFWAGMTMVSIFSTFVGFALHYFTSK